LLVGSDALGVVGVGPAAVRYWEVPPLPAALGMGTFIALRAAAPWDVATRAMTTASVAVGSNTERNVLNPLPILNRRHPTSGGI